MIGLRPLALVACLFLPACSEEKAAGEVYREASGRMVAARAYLEALAQEPGIERTDSGLLYRIDRQSQPRGGPVASHRDDVLVHYRGSLPDGDEFDSSYDRNYPARFAMRDLIAGWREGLKLMQEGDAFTFYIPPQLGYGPRGSPPVIPANSVLVFEVELLVVHRDDPVL